MSNATERRELEDRNETIGARIRGVIVERDRLETEIETLQSERLNNTKQINRLLRAEIAATESEDE